MKKKKSLAYAEAEAELEKIISEIEQETVDVDVLTEKVKRAIQLIKFCKTKLKTTEDEVRKVLSEIEEKTEGDLVNAGTDDDSNDYAS